ncbi:MAG: hypothetical protein IPG58_17575 [Acidobacteria bacterium]|nr:hypothetical protein [Acidobacteriota bacterium]
MKKCPECGRNYNDDSMSFVSMTARVALRPGIRSGLSGAIATGFPATNRKPRYCTRPAAPGEAPTSCTDPYNGTDCCPSSRSGGRASRRILSGLSEKQSLSANQAAKPLICGVVAVVVLVGGFFGYKYFAPTKQIESIAVMPFVNESGNADVEYLSDGMTETLISSLSNIPNLSVKARSTVFYYKGKEPRRRRSGKN